MPTEAIISDLDGARMKRNAESLDDVTLVWTTYGLLLDFDDEIRTPLGARTPKSRALTRYNFSEIARRWIPDDVWAAAIAELDEGLPGGE